MSATDSTRERPRSPVSSGRPARRVRHDLRDQALVMLFSLAASSLLALALTTVVR